jgi:hypothetical protein
MPALGADKVATGPRARFVPAAPASTLALSHPFTASRTSAMSLGKTDTE